jgi:hypothetical protein
VADRPPIAGYVRCDAIYPDARWRFELLSEHPKVAGTYCFCSRGLIYKSGRAVL